MKSFQSDKLFLPFLIGGDKIPFTTRVSTKAKYVRVNMSVENGIQVVIPAAVQKRFSDPSKLYEVVESQRDWIIRNWERVQKKPDETTATYGSGSWVPFLGDRYRVLLVVGKAPAITWKEGNLFIELPISHREDQSLIRNLLESWYRRQAKVYFPQRVTALNQAIGFSYGKITIKDQKTRWGSCSGKGNLNFNWRLMLAPLQVVDSVIIHELCHLKELNHSEAFWQLVRQYDPVVDESEQWLKEHGQTLHL